MAKKVERELEAWVDHCAALLRDRAYWLDEYEHTMLDENVRYRREPTEGRREFAKRIAWETEGVDGVDGVPVDDIIRLAASVKGLLPFESEEEITRLEQDCPRRLSRRLAERLFDIAKRYAM